MTVAQSDILSVDLRFASEDICECLGGFLDHMREEGHPEDPPIPLTERIAGWRNRPPSSVTEQWVVFGVSGEIIAFAGAGYWNSEENRHLLHFDIDVLASRRRQGLGSRLLERVVSSARRETRTLLMSSATNRFPSGEAFLTAIGAEKKLEMHTNQLLIEDLEPSLLDRWVERAPSREFELALWEGAYPEEHLEEMAELWIVMNTAPRGDLDMEDFLIRPEELRQIERAIFAGGHQRTSMVVRERSSGRLIGFTEVFWTPSRPERLGQGNTAVMPDYRRRGVGRWLKAAMLRHILRTHPEIRQVRTGNADLNEAMLKINRELGYKPYIASSEWQVETARAEAYLKSRA